MTSRDPGQARRQPTSSENPPQAQESNFWTTGKGVLTIIGIAVAATVVVIAFIFSTLDQDNEFGQPATYSNQPTDRKSTRLNSSHVAISYAVFCLKKKTNNN